MSLLQFEDDIMPFTFADVLILRYLLGAADGRKTINDFHSINMSSNLNWSFKSQMIKFVKRFFKDPYRKQDTVWITGLAAENNINIKYRLSELSRLLSS